MNTIYLTLTKIKVAIFLMPLHLDENKAHYQIKSYQPGKLIVNNTSFHHSLILTSNQLFENWRPQTVTDITAQDFAAIIELAPHILLIGTGALHEFLDLTLYGHLHNVHIGVEVMSTIAAARTFNALASENRNVAAALIV